MKNQDPQEQNGPRTLWRHILGYSMGEGVSSLTMNGISSFAMLYYTQALGLRFSLAGLAFSIASFWDAIADPVMGHISDNTRSRWGRRHPYLLLGGLLMAVSFYYLWAVPTVFSKGSLLFLYVVSINLFFRTAFAIFSVPYMALGFEVCTDYHQRSQLQSTRSALNMLVNLLGPALAWFIFFPDKPGSGVEATSVPANFLHMGTTFAIVTVMLTVIVVLATRRHISDTRSQVFKADNSAKAFYRDSLEIITDRYLRPVVLFYCIGMVGAIFVSTLQMYLYVYYMHLTALQKTFIHGGGMVLCALGAVVATPLGRRFDKKLAVCFGAATTMCANLLAGFLFLSGILTPTTVWTLGGFVVPIAVIIFGACNMLNWFGVGIFATLASSMTADVAEVNELESGVRKDGGYAAIFTFTFKLIASLAMFIASGCLAWVGFVNGSDKQTPEAIRWLVLLTFGLGSLFSLLVIPIVLRYPIGHAFMARVKSALAKKNAVASDEALGCPVGQTASEE